MGRGSPIRTRPWKRPPWRRKRRLPGEFNIISEATATAFAASAPFRDGSCGQIVDFDPRAMSCQDTVPMTPIVLSSASEGDFGGQPIWPKHVVESVRGDLFFFKVGSLAESNQIMPGAGCMVHCGIRKTRFDYDAVVPAFETDFDPAHEDDAEARWIWLKHFYLPPSPSLATTTSTGISGGLPAPLSCSGVGGQAQAFDLTWSNATASRAHVVVNERNRVKLEENEGLVLLITVSQDPFTSLFSCVTSPMGEIHNLPATLGVVPYVRTYVRQSK